MNMKEIYATKGIEVGGYRSADDFYLYLSFYITYFLFE